jgi:hypothetical protein
MIAAIGLGRGAFIGWAVSRDLDLPASLPADHLVLVAAAAIASGVLAAALPAPRAGRRAPRQCQRVTTHKVGPDMPAVSGRDDPKAARMTRSALHRPNV